MLLAASGCMSSSSTGTAYRARRTGAADRVSNPTSPYIVYGVGTPPVMFAGPVVSAGHTPAAQGPAQRSGPGMCTEVSLRLPGVITFHGDRGSVMAAVETDLPPGRYTIHYDAKDEVLHIAPWETKDEVLRMSLAGSAAERAILDAYLASMTAPIPLRVVDAAARGAGGRCDTCTRVDTLPAAEAAALIDALGQDFADGERARWLAWAARFETQPGTSLADEVRARLAAGGARAPARTTRAALGDPALQQSWSALHRWEQDLWRAYIERHGETADVTDAARSDLRITEYVRLSMALRMSPRHMKPGAHQAAELLFNDPLFIGGTVFGITAYFALWLAPEPIFSKAASVLTTIGLVALAGFTAAEIVTLARAWMRLRQDAARATTLAELERAAGRFGQSMGGSAMRILVVLASVVGGSALASGAAAGAAPAAASTPARIAGVTGGGAAVAGAGVAEVGWAVQVLADGAVVIMSMSAAHGSGSGGNRGKLSEKSKRVSGDELKARRAEFSKVKPQFWKQEASVNPRAYSPENLARMRQGRAPIGSDGHPMELHHVRPLAEGGTNSFDNLRPMLRTNHRLGDNYKKHHPGLP